MSAQSASEKGRQTRRRLVEAAVELIPEVGWGAVTTRLVAERAGVRPGLVHYHFDSVSDLLGTAAVEFAEAALAAPMRSLRAAPDPAAGVARLMEALEVYSGHDPGSLLITEAYLAATRDAALRTALADMLDRFRADAARWLDGHGVPDAEACAVLLCALVDGIVLHRGLAGTPGVQDLMGPLSRLVAAPAAGDDGRNPE
ncbi:TetR/AcrR family transcriptional regulator [Actinorugispora endophytica]|uniref:TetR family transcriptional regulator n=1 Tax=Actinorugispora endophytica TaxID=1605990 RepID=A0A4V3D8N8_9ACTN|nr:TetR family transcriptional regulator [Actinorugispora endophytica]TDQ52449.1 TetR family transcriptional regulator [Actinorugispora endophytica]